jgi:glycosyltransferase involved in cell wall biosynthesis
VKHENIPDFLHKIDVLFNPITDEGISIISLEAMACGRPTIMIDRGDRYPIINNKTGFLIDDKLQELLKLLEHLNDNRIIIKKTSKNARKIVENEFSNQAIIPKIKNIYESLTNS